MLDIKDLHVSYGHIQALSGVSIRVPHGGIVSIIGSNGAGKTTLLNTISGIVKQKKVTYYLRDRNWSGLLIPSSSRAWSKFRKGARFSPD